MAHFGHPWGTECIVMMRKHPNVYAEISGTFYRPWELYNANISPMESGQAHTDHVRHDWPITTPRETVEGLSALNQFA